MHRLRSASGHLCRQLGGIPLAFELAASRIDVFGAAELAARLFRAWQRGLKCMGNLFCMGLLLLESSPPPDAPTTPTTARPPEWTWTCSTVTFCWPLPRWRLSASSRVAYVFFSVSREFCLGDRFATDCLVSQRVRSPG